MSKDEFEYFWISNTSGMRRNIKTNRMELNIPGGWVTIKQVEPKDVAKRMAEIVGQLGKKIPEMCVKTAKEFEEQMRLLNDWDKHKGVDMGEKKEIKAGDYITTKPAKVKGFDIEYIGDNPMLRIEVEPFIGTYDKMYYYAKDVIKYEGERLGDKLSGEELKRLHRDYCVNRAGENCDGGCEILEIIQGQYDTCCHYSMLEHGDEIKDFLASYKAQKEQEKEELFKPGDIVIDTRDGKVMEAVVMAYRGRESIEWLNRTGRKTGCKLVCRAEDRLDRVKQD